MIWVQKVIEVFLEEVVVGMGCKSWECGEDHLRKKKNEQEQAVTRGADACPVVSHLLEQ